MLTIASLPRRRSNDSGRSPDSGVAHCCLNDDQPKARQRREKKKKKKRERETGKLRSWTRKATLRGRPNGNVACPSAHLVASEESPSSSNLLNHWPVIGKRVGSVSPPALEERVANARCKDAPSKPDESELLEEATSRDTSWWTSSFQSR
ncbi:hypothetical protein P170DRAFT_277887 [Aspergillus steynii IBT 23096]|uniref:Uncharacterized protein n=1 Tax=Aspergillus steynii IBT 23096 TaxID=1392250 RepID=A0A2I2FX88_9EURO|nr:uncharacterized protein P170DRAFT_277887 [Aspergillus steynii IBT 23096]PLB45255.1 hypothetical protein P170DRAFT_277887 [Aspergillus steynii IBT 23096]